MKRSWFIFVLISFSFFSCQDKKGEKIKKNTNIKPESQLNVTLERISESEEIPVDSLKVVFQEIASLFSSKTTENKKALNYYNKFIRLFEEQENEVAIGHLNRTIGYELCGEYNFDKGIPYLLKSSENFINAKDYNSLSISYNNLSLAYHDFGDYSKGIEYANLVLKTVNENPNTTNFNAKWYAYNNMGINYDDNQQYVKAIESHMNALPFAINASDSSYSYNNIGNTLKKMKNYQKSKEFFALSLKHSVDYSDVYHFATLYSNLMDIERLMKNYQSAARYIDSAKFYAIKSKSPEKLIDFYNYAYIFKNEMKDFQSSSQYLSKYVTIKDSLLNAEKAKIVYDYQVKYETEKKEKQIAQSKLSSKQKNIWLILLSGGIIIGLVVFLNFKTKAQDKQKQLSLENELLKAHTNSKIQEQRLEISRDLHDSVGAQLTFINSLLDSLKNSSLKLDVVAINKINSLSNFSENTITELKNTLWVLNSKEIYLLDLKAKILNFIKNASEAKEDITFDFNFEISENKCLSSKQAVNIFRSIQETVNNAMKHAQASEIKIDILQIDKNLNIKISDNGIGFDREMEKNNSFGLRNIESRIATIHGEIEIESFIGKGTVYRIKIAI